MFRSGELTVKPNKNEPKYNLENNDFIQYYKS